MANYDSDDSEATLVWSAHDEVDETLKDIFENKLATATKNVLDVEVTPEKTYKKFILNSRGFFNLQAYVVSAADLPQNDQRFQDIMPKDKCKKLTELDAEIYEKTKTAIVGVASSCATFANDGMPKMVTSASLTISYCKYALRNLVQDEETNIRHNLEIIMQDKYKEKDSWDDDFYDARDTAKTSLEELAEQASKKKEEVDKIYNILSTFKTQTMSYDSQIKFLRQQYKDGPVKNPNKDITQPYATILNAKLQKAIDDTVKFLKEAEDEKDRKNTGLAVGIALFWFGPIGCIAITSAILSISELNVKIKALETELAQARSDQAEITLLLEKVSMVTKQFEDIGEKMEHAIQGLTELSKLFSTQFETYDTLATYLGDLENAVVKQVALRMRKKYIMKHLNGSIQAFQDLLASAEEFKETVMSQADLESWKAKANKDLTK